MDMAAYDPQAVARYFDSFGVGEYERHDRSPEQRVKFELHAQCLRRFVSPRSRVLEIGPGPGRFTEILAGMGCGVTVVELSAEQLRLNADRARAGGYAGSIETWLQGDICDLSALAGEQFDHIVAFGGPFSYVLERRGEALRECQQVLAPGGHLLLSVMSKWGTIHAFLRAIAVLDVEEIQAVTRTGDITPATAPSSVEGGHFFHMFTARELRAFLEDAGLVVELLAASNAVSTTWSELLLDEDHFAATLALEEEATQAAGAVDMGTHIIAVAKGGAAPMPN